MFAVLRWGVFVFVVLFSGVFVVSFCGVWRVVLIVSYPLVLVLMILLFRFLSFLFVFLVSGGLLVVISVCRVVLRCFFFVVLFYSWVVWVSVRSCVVLCPVYLMSFPVVLQRGKG